jgi:hypothetical protein
MAGKGNAPEAATRAPIPSKRLDIRAGLPWAYLTIDRGSEAQVGFGCWSAGAYPPRP